MCPPPPPALLLLNKCQLCQTVIMPILIVILLILIVTGLSRINNVLFLRKRQHENFLPVVHAKRDSVDGRLGQSRQSEIMRFGYPSRFL